MKIKSRVTAPIVWHENGTKKRHTIFPGERDELLDVNQPEIRFQLIALKDAKLIDFKEDLRLEPAPKSKPKPKPKKDEDVRRSTKRFKRAGSDGDTNQSRGRVSSKKQDESPACGEVAE